MVIVSSPGPPAVHGSSPGPGPHRGTVIPGPGSGRAKDSKFEVGSAEDFLIRLKAEGSAVSAEGVTSARVTGGGVFFFFC